ncbi:MAG: hypothetical protein BAJALOKI3v1_30097 [Promethearchaeota archaeon]|nr:MAG: hypothetical protein BAJALOKI3v1_30097 [Candidatus Lokiarchaeota archaeon]
MINRSNVLIITNNVRLNKMVKCEELKKGDVFVCPDCGLELTVSEACDCAEEGACSEQGFVCCGTAMKKK